jgi:malate dehydrogenase (oxaloacetate-decarboxylating)(NADP+)
MDEQLKQAALAYHLNPKPGKISVTPTKPLSNQLDLSLAYSPGVAAACEAIHADPLDAQKYVARQPGRRRDERHAVLGLGNIGPLAAKPVMEGKGCLFKKFAGIDVFDIELSESTPTSWSRRSRCSSRRSAASTSRTSRRPNASTSSRSCASA